MRAALISGMAVLAALLAPLGNLLPFSLTTKIDRETLQALLDILTNSMLTVATFSLSIMVTAHLATDGNATPRAYRLLQQDRRTQTVIATFIGAFIYALTLTILMNTGLFVEGELALVYILTVLVIGMVVVAILRWVGHLDGLGSVEATMRRADERAEEAIKDFNAYPYLGGRAALPVVPAGATKLISDQTGYVQNIATTSLSDTAGEIGVTVHVQQRAGDWVMKGETLAQVVGDVRLTDEQATSLRANFLISDRREHGQDILYSLLLLTEIGERALSPGINDPRTGVYIASRLSRLISEIEPEREMAEPAAPNVYMPGLNMMGLVATTLDPISRDGRTFFEIGHAIQTAARDLAKHDDPGIAQSARGLSARGLSYSRDGILILEDLRRISEHAIADGPAPVTSEKPKEAVVEALGEEDNSSFFRETS
ncbi:DUF2254 domain-containing protein [Palleronia sp. THAF1]|uniref:DUF2254 domain-containing protein n=1 Tax=Palleronia sp. THAF1 TaxID=2587842 RepID=UPI0015623193|nr:DUF2254 family protein [Palleronia sp. THAF1]